MEAFFVIVMAALMAGVGVLALVAVSRVATLRPEAAAGGVQDLQERA